MPPGEGRRTVPGVAASDGARRGARRSARGTILSPFKRPERRGSSIVSSGRARRLTSATTSARSTRPSSSGWWRRPRRPAAIRRFDTIGNCSASWLKTERCAMRPSLCRCPRSTWTCPESRISCDAASATCRTGFAGWRAAKMPRRSSWTTSRTGSSRPSSDVERAVGLGFPGRSREQRDGSGFDRDTVGVYDLDYRWNRVRYLLWDLHRGLGPRMNQPTLGLLEKLRPPSGFRTEAALGATYSADLLTCMAVLTTMDGGDGEQVRYGRVEAYRALDHLRDKVRICHQAGRVSRRDGAKYPSLALLDRVLVPVRLPGRGSFHPKVWLVRQMDEANRERFVLVVSSRNITTSTDWDLGIAVEGALTGGGVALAARARLRRTCAGARR